MTKLFCIVGCVKNHLESIRIREAGLNKRRQSLLNRITDKGMFASFPRNDVEDRDLAYLSAAAGDEFALLRGKH